MKSTRATMRRLSPFLAIAALLFVCVGAAFADSKERNPVESLTPAEIDALVAMYNDKAKNGLYESDTAYRDAVFRRASQQSAQRVRQARQEVQNLENQQIQSAFLAAMRDFKEVYARSTKDKEWYHGAAAYGGAAAAHWKDKQAAVEAAVADGDATASASTAAGYQRLAQGSDALHRMAKIAKEYEDLSKKSEAASTGGTAAGVDFAASTMRAFLAHAKEYAGVLQARQSGELAKLAPLGGSIPGIRGPDSEQIIESVLATEASVRKMKDMGYYAGEAMKKIDTANKAVQTLDRMINNPDFARLENSEYLTGEQKDFGKAMIAAGEAVKGLADIFGADLGNVPAAILKNGGQGIEAIGQSVGYAAALEEKKRQGGLGGIASEFRGAIPEFADVGLRVRENGATGELTIPGGAAGEVTLASGQLQALRDALSAFTSLAGRNPTQEELARLAAGGRIVVDGRPVTMNSLSNPHNRTDSDLRGAERTELDAFIEAAIAGLSDAEIKKLHPDSGATGGWTRQDHRDKREEMNRLTQELYGEDVSATMYGADLVQDGQVTEDLEQKIEDRKTTLERLQDLLDDESLTQRERLEAEKRYLDELRRLRELAEEREKEKDKPDDGAGDGEGEGGGSIDDALTELTGGKPDPDPDRARSTEELLENAEITRAHRELLEAFETFDESALDLAQQIRNVSSAGGELCEDPTVGFLFYATTAMNEIVQSLQIELLEAARAAAGMAAGGRNLSEPDMDMLNSRDQLRVSAGVVMAGRAQGTFELLAAEIERLDAACDLDELARSGEEVAERDQDPESGIDGSSPPVTGSGEDTSGNGDGNGGGPGGTGGDFVTIGSAVRQDNAGDACNLGATATVAADVTFPQRISPNSTFTVEVDVNWSTRGPFVSAELNVIVVVFEIERTEKVFASSGNQTLRLTFNSAEIDFNQLGNAIFVAAVVLFECDEETGDSGISNQIGVTQPYARF
ncbi:MAG: hypothetical protein HKN20_08490 [Gemmatimonadetes bacterium]|nr:hypothetical protein [Gemmatimonadota bacterium]